MLYSSVVMLVFALAGLSVGSFLNLCIDRLPRDQSIVKPPSHCPVCQRKIAAFDLVPVLNYFWLRGRCRYCHTRIPIRLPIIEMITGIAFAFLYWHFGFDHSLELSLSLVYVSWFIVIFFIDLDHQLILNKVIYPGIVVAFAFSFLWPDLGVVNALIGGGIGMGMILLPYIVYPKGMGEGDIKLALMIGLMTGYPEVFVALLLAVIGGGLLSAILLLFQFRKRTEAIPFGPFLVTAAMVALLWGEPIFDWYWGLF